MSWWTTSRTTPTKSWLEEMPPVKGSNSPANCESSSNSIAAAVALT